MHINDTENPREIVLVLSYDICNKTYKTFEKLHDDGLEDFQYLLYAQHVKRENSVELFSSLSF